MGIIIRLGNIGSGKTLCAVKELFDNMNGLQTYTNIQTKKIKNIVKIKSDMIIKKEVLSVSKTGVEKFKLTVNKEYWQSLNKGVNIVLDEFHALADSRRAMSNVNKTVMDWVALIRRVLGEQDGQSGDLVVITQLERRIDVIIKELATMILYHTCYYQKHCRDCGFGWNENSDSPEKMSYCGNCGRHHITKSNFHIHIHYFSDIMDFYKWQYRGTKSYFRIQILKNMDRYFQFYNTAQWDDMFSEYY